MKKIYVCGYCGHSEKQPFEVCANCGKDYTGSKWITGIPKPRRKELQAEIDSLNVNLVAKEAEIKRLRIEIGGLDADKNILQRIDSLIGENVAAADDLDASESEKSALQAEIDRQVTKTGLLESAIKMLKYENEEERRYFGSNQESLYFNTEEQKKALQAEIEQLKAEIDAMQHAYFLYEEPQPDGKLRAPIGKVLASKDADLAAKQAIIDEQAAELYEALATCTELADIAARVDGWRAIYEWGRQ